MAAQSQFSLAWDAHKNNICTGLSSLQQNGEFVDMTLAADGHHVKVHQIIMALASPYIKELIASAHNPHPIIFLNKISYNTLCSILEYIYTGEVLVGIEHLSELIEAGKELHIKGLEDMMFDLNLSTALRKLNQMKPSHPTPVAPVSTKETEDVDNNDFCYFEITDSKEGVKYVGYEPATNTQTTEMQDEEPMIEEGMELEELVYNETMQSQEPENEETVNEDVENSEGEAIAQANTPAPKVPIKPEKSDVNIMQYTVSNQGSLQLVLNRFLYYLKHTKRDGGRQWRCVDYLSNIRCPAAVVTSDDIVLQRIKAHTHNFHDKKILKKVHAGAIFSQINEAIMEGATKKTEHALERANAKSANTAT